MASIAALVVVSTTTAVAQAPASLGASLFTIAGQPATAPPGWTVHATDLPTTTSPASVRAFGPGVRITTAVPTTLYRPGAALTGDGTVGALVFVDATSPAIYGITLGGENGWAFLVQPAGAATIVRLQNGQVNTAVWTAAPAVTVPAAGRLQPCRIEARVQGTRAELLMNGTVVAATTIAPGALDGVPGIYNGAGTLGVVGLAVQTAAAVAPGAVR